MSEFVKTLDDNERICPYCSHSYQPENEDFSEDERVEECEECGGKYYAYDEVSMTHSARPDCTLNGIEHDWENNEKYKLHKFCSLCGKCEAI